MSSVLDRPSLDELYENLFLVMGHLLHEMKSRSEAQKEDQYRNSLTSLSNIIFYDKENFKNKRNLNDFFSVLIKSEYVSQDVAQLIYMYLFSKKVSFLQAVKEEELNENSKYSPLEEDPMLKEIIGNNIELNAKQILGAIQQNPRNFVWVKELSKNSKESGATQIDIDVMKNDKNELVVKFADNGSGVDPENMYYFYVPRLSSKPNKSGDINFGWGLFSLFHTFKSVKLESSVDGMTLSVINFKIQDSRVMISQSIKKSQTGCFHRGTTLILTKPGEADVIDPILIQSQVLQVVGDLNSEEGEPIKIKFNHNELQDLGRHFLVPSEMISHQEVQLGIGSRVELNGYIHPKKGIYYKGLFHSEKLEPYLQSGSEVFLKKLSSLPNSIAINLVGDLSQNANRTQFLEQELLDPIIQNFAMETAFKGMAIYNAKDPEYLKDDLAYDFYYDFKRPESQMEDLAHQTLNEGPAEIGKMLDSPVTLASYIALLPLDLTEKRQSAPVSLYSVLNWPF